LKVWQRLIVSDVNDGFFGYGLKAELDRRCPNHFAMPVARQVWWLTPGQLNDGCDDAVAGGVLKLF
jgi:hypothetical protein